ncbi:hypothetical protein [Chryseobacterium koreense]
MNNKALKNINQILILLLLLSCKKINYGRPEEIFLIPKNLDNFVVIYEAEKNIDFNKDVTYIIPKNGVLKVNFQRNKGILNHKYILVDKAGKEKYELQNFAVQKYKNKIQNNTIYQLDAIDGSYIDSSFVKFIRNKTELSTQNPNTKKWFGIIIGKANDNQNKLRGKLFAKIDSISKK